MISDEVKQIRADWLWTQDQVRRGNCPSITFAQWWRGLTTFDKRLFDSHLTMDERDEIRREEEAQEAQAARAARAAQAAQAALQAQQAQQAHEAQAAQAAERHERERREHEQAARALSLALPPAPAPAPAPAAAAESPAPAPPSAVESAGSLCSRCKERRPKDAFTQAQLKKSAAVRRCKLCFSAELLPADTHPLPQAEADPLTDMRTRKEERPPERSGASARHGARHASGEDRSRDETNSVGSSAKEQTISAISVGARVVLQGLVSRPELNGRFADVVEWVESRGRWKVRFENGEMLAVQPTSLHMAPKPLPAMTTPTPAPSSDRSSDGASKRRLHSLAAAQGIPIESAALVEGAPTSTRPSSARKADAASAIAPWVGARVTLCGLGSRPELNGRIGVVDRRNMTGGVERWEVQLVDRQKPGMRDGPPILIKPANMQVLATPPPASSRRGAALQISPCPLEAARDAIPVSVAPEPFPAATEVQDMAILQARRGWRRVLGLKAYTARATYPDLYVYFDGADQTSPINHLGMRAFSAYPADIGGLPTHGIRGEMVAIRLEPPRVRSFVRFEQGEAAAEAHAVEEGNASQFVQTIEVEEMRDTLLFYTTRDAAEIARERDFRRMMAIACGRSTSPGMPSGAEIEAIIPRPSRGGAGVGTGAGAPAPSKDERLQRLVQQVRSGSANAAGALADMRDDESRVAISRSGGIVPLVALLTAQEPAAGAEAARALRSLAVNAENQVLIAQAGAIAPLVTLVQSGTDGQKEHAAGALRNLTVNAESAV